MKRISFYILTIAALLVYTNQTNAFSIATDTDVKVADQKIDENYYAAGGSVSIDGEYAKDVFIAGGDVVVNGEISGDLIILGGEVKIVGKVAGDTRIIGGRAIILGQIDGELLVVAGRVELLEGAQINGESVFVTAEINQSSKITKDTKILAGAVYLDSLVGGNTDITTQRIVFGSKSDIVGTLKYYAPTKAEEISGSKISGDVSFNETKKIGERGIVKSTILNLLSFWLILKFVTTLILAFLLVYVFKVFSQGAVDLATGTIVRSFFSGFFGIIIIPIVSIILFVSLIALPIGFLVMLSYIFILLISPAISGIIVGNILFGLFDKSEKNEVSFKKASIGVVLLTALQFVPVVGDLTKLFFTIIAFGAITRYTYGNVVR